MKIKRKCHYCKKDFIGNKKKRFCKKSHYAKWIIESGKGARNSRAYYKTEIGKEAGRKSSLKWHRKKYGVKPENYRV